MFTKSLVPQSLVDAVSKIINEDQQDMSEGAKHASRPGTQQRPGSAAQAQAAKARKDQLKADYAKAQAEKQKKDMSEEEEFKPKKRLILEPEKMTKEEESGLRMAAHAAHRDGKKTFEFQGKTYPVNVNEEESDCVTPMGAKKIAKKEVGKHEKTMHHKGKVEKMDEMDKSQTPPGRDDPENPYAKSSYVKPVNTKKFNKDALKSLNKTFNKTRKEEVEQVDEEERHMSDDEMKEREHLVKSMKKNLAGFKSRYGERAKNVMYATATKRAMGEEAEQLDELSSDTLKSYVKKRGKDVEADIRDAKAARQNAQDYPEKSAKWNDESQWLGQRARKGLDNLKLASKKINQRNEEAENDKEPYTKPYTHEVYDNKGVVKGRYTSLKSALRGVDTHDRRYGASIHSYRRINEELGGISTISDEAVDTADTTTDTLAGRKKGGGLNQHGPDRKVKLKAEEGDFGNKKVPANKPAYKEKTFEDKRPIDGVPFVTNEEEKESGSWKKDSGWKAKKPDVITDKSGAKHTPMSRAKDLARKSFAKIRKETMMGTAGATSEEESK